MELIHLILCRFGIHHLEYDHMRVENGSIIRVYQCMYCKDIKEVFVRY